MDNSLNDLLKSLQDFDFGVETHSFSIFYPHFSFILQNKIDSSSRQKRLEWLKLVILIFSRFLISVPIKSDLFNNTIVLNEKPYWTLHKRRKQLILWVGHHGENEYYRIQSNRNMIICIDTLSEDLYFTENNEIIKLIIDCGYKPSPVDDLDECFYFSMS